MPCLMLGIRTLPVTRKFAVGVRFTAAALTGLVLAALGWPTVAPAQFTNVTNTPGVLPVSLTGARAAWGDYNNDGYVDLNHGGILLENNANGTFSNPGVNFDGTGIWGDYDKDGYLDWFNFSDKRIYHNDGGSDFTEVAKPSLPSTISAGGAWGDFNGDTYLDLYVGGYENASSSVYYPDSILTNNRNGTFSHSWTQPIDTVFTPGRPRPARGITTADWDQDGDLDVYVSNYRREPNQLRQNGGAGDLSNDVAGTYNATASTGHSIGSVFGDFNNDGLIDLFAGNFAHQGQPQSRFLKNLGQASNPSYKFQDMGTGGIPYQESYASPTAGDVDNDGDLDLYFTSVYPIASGGVPNWPRLFLNQGNFNFVDVTGAWGLPAGVPFGSSYAAFADYDDDGYLDLVSARQLYRNNGGNNHYLKVNLDGSGTFDRTAIGAQVRIDVPGLGTLTRQVEGGVGEGNQNDHTLHFGLGSYTGPLTLQVRSPDGTTHNVDVPSVDQTVTITPQQNQICQGADEIYFGSFGRSSIIHFCDNVFVSETFFPKPDLFTDPPDFRDLTLGPDGKLYVGLLQAEAVLRFDPATDTFDTFGGDPNNYLFASGISSGGAPFTGPAGLAFGGPNNDLFVVGGEFGTAYVKRFDGTTGDPIAPDPFVSGGLNNEPNNIIATPDGALLVAGGGGTIRRVDPVTGGVTVFAETGTVAGNGPRVKGMVFSPDGSTLYVGTDDGPNDIDAVIRYDATTGERITDAPDPFVPSGLNGLNPMLPTSNIEGLAFSPDGSTLFVGSLGSGPNPAANAIYRFDPDTGMPLDGVDENGAIIPYIFDIGTTNSQGGPGSGPAMAPQRIVVLPSGLTGDYNGNGIVDGPDLLLWQRTLGDSVPPGSGADGSGDGTVGPEDLDIWEDRFGSTSAVASAAVVPEPSTIAQFALALLVLTAFGRKRLGIRNHQV